MDDLNKLPAEEGADQLQNESSYNEVGLNLIYLQLNAFLGSYL